MPEVQQNACVLFFRIPSRSVINTVHQQPKKGALARPCRSSGFWLPGGEPV